jgi:hypothetical protein
MSRTPIQDATDRLRALASLQPLSSQIYMPGNSLLQEDITTILDELHRLHVAVSAQRKQLDRGKTPRQAAPGRTKSPGRSPQHQAKTRKRKT